ncbi:hypothetical protein AAY473_025428 [Plecturocebus cupreus]
MPVIPATRKAEAGESLEPGRWRGRTQSPGPQALEVPTDKPLKEGSNTINPSPLINGAWRRDRICFKILLGCADNINLEKQEKVVGQQAWCHVPVIPATLEAEAEEWLEARRWRLQKCDGFKQQNLSSPSSGGQRSTIKVLVSLPKCWDYRHEPPCLALDGDLR